MTTAKRLTAAILIGLGAGAATAQTADVDARVAELKAMEPAARQAVLKGMDMDERRGLWFELRKSQFGEGGTADGFYRDAIANGPGAAPRTTGGARAPGTITYDDGVITNTFGGGAIIGNRFNTHTGVPVLANGTVTAVQAVVVQGSSGASSSAGFVIEGPQTMSGGAFAIFSTFTGGSTVFTNTTETVSFTGFSANYTGSSFFVLFGDFASVWVPAFGTGSTQSQGHHGVVGYTGGMGPNITSTFDFGGTLNSLVRASGNILPVELMEFGVD